MQPLSASRSWLLPCPNWIPTFRSLGRFGLVLFVRVVRLWGDISRTEQVDQRADFPLWNSHRHRFARHAGTTEQTERGAAEQGRHEGESHGAPNGHQF